MNRTNHPKNQVIFSSTGSINIFRSSWTDDALYAFLKAPNEVTMSGHAPFEMHQLTFDIWAKGAYPIVDAGNPRFLPYGGANSLGHTSWFFYENGELNTIYRGGKGQYGDTCNNPAYITSKFTSPNLDYIKGEMDVTVGYDYPNERAAYSPFHVTRNMMMVEDEYFIVADSLTSKKENIYSMVIPFGSANGNKGKKGVPNDNWAIGNLFFDGEKNEWYNKTTNQRIKVGKNNVTKIIWETQSEINSINKIPNPVNMTVNLNPSIDINISHVDMHMGSYGQENEWTIPFLKAHQNGENVKYLTIYYPNAKDEDMPIISNIPVSGEKGIHYATTISKGETEDIVMIGDNELISAQDMKSNARISYIRKVKGSISTNFMADGTSIIYKNNNLLRYQTSVFATILLILLMYLNHKENIRLRKTVPLSIITVFGLCISHTGTYLFLLSFLIGYVFFKSTLWGLFQRKMFSLITIMLSLYTFTMYVFPRIHFQYHNKATFFLTVSKFISDKINFDLFSELGSIFYTEIFLNRNIVHAIMWSAMIYSLCKMLIFMRERTLHRMQTKREKMNLTIPFIGTIRNISHAVVTTPVWIGPLNSLLSLLGYFRLNIKGKCMFLTAFAITLLPASLNPGSTGALREIYYLLIIVPIAAAAGYYYGLEFISKIKKQKIRKLITFIFSLMCFSSIILTPLIGNTYFIPSTSGSNQEIDGLNWLSGVGNENEKVVGYGYRHMVNVYSNKSNPRVRYGTETRVFLVNLLNSVYSEQGSEYADGLYKAFGTNYIILSEKILRNLEVMDQFSRKKGQLKYQLPNETKIGDTDVFDKIFANTHNFIIYKYIPHIIDIANSTDDSARVSYFDNLDVSIKDAGTSFIVETDTYVVRLNKKNTRIEYFGDNETDFLDEGYMQDYVGLGFRGGPKHDFYKIFYFNGLLYHSVQRMDNQVTYVTYLRDHQEETVSTMTIKYTFYNKAIKREISFSDDWLHASTNHAMRLLFYTSQYTPNLHKISYFHPLGEETKKTIYPSDDNMEVEDMEYNGIFISNGEKGIYREYAGTNRNPTEIKYKKSTVNGYCYASIGMRREVSSSETMNIVEYLTLGDIETAKSNVAKYKKVSLSLYKNGFTPLVLVDSIENHYQNISNNPVITKLSQNYTYGISINGMEPTIDPRLVDNISYAPILSTSKIRGYYNLTTQRNHLFKLNDWSENNGLPESCVLPNLMKYNLDTISLLDEENMSCIIGKAMNSYWGPFYEGSIRNPSYVKLHGEQTKIVSLPITYPLGTRLRDESIGSFLWSWKRNIETSIKTDDMLVLVLPYESFFGPYSDKLLNLINKTSEKGFAISTASDVVSHFRLLDKIDYLVQDEGENLTVTLVNRNDVGVDGLTFKFILDKHGMECNYIIEGAKSHRFVSEWKTCRMYASLDVGANESVQITVHPNFTSS